MESRSVGDAETSSSGGRDDAESVGEGGAGSAAFEAFLAFFLDDLDGAGGAGGGAEGNAPGGAGICWRSRSRRGEGQPSSRAVPVSSERQGTGARKGRPSRRARRTHHAAQTVSPPAVFSSVRANSAPRRPKEAEPDSPSTSRQARLLAPADREPPSTDEAR